VVLTPCDAPYIFSCGTDAAARNSCTSGNGSFSIQAGSAGVLIGTVEDGPSITLATTAYATATAFSTTTATSAGSSDCKSEKNTTVGVGAGLGAGFGIALIAAVAFFWLWRRAKKEIILKGLHFEEPATHDVQK
jgi:hypothetical protein